MARWTAAVRGPVPAVTEGHTEAEAGDSTAGSNVDASNAKQRWAGQLFGLTVAAAVIPIVVAAARAIGRGWIPIGDNAFFALRSLDVFNQHIPLLGTWSSSSQSYGINLNNPGPLLFDVLAIPTKVLGAPVGIPITVAALNVIAVVGVAIVAYRRGGATLGIVAMAATTALVWAMGSEVLYEPWQPHSLMLPFLLFIFLVWSATCGDIVALPFIAVVGSYLLQTHLTYAVLVPALSAWALGSLLVSLNRARRRQPETWRQVRGSAVRVGLVTSVLLVVAWAQPIIEQFTSSPPGNLTRLARAARAPHVTAVGFQLGAKLVAAVVSLPPLWFRPSISQTFDRATGWHPASGIAAAGSLAVVVAVLAACAWAAHRRADRVALAAILLAVVLLVLAIVTAAKSPTTSLGPYTPHGLRWLWPLAAFIFFAFVATLVRRSPAGKPHTTVLIGLTLVAVVLAALNLPTANLGGGANSQQYAIPVQKRLNASMGDLTHQGPLLVDDLFLEAVFDPYSATVLAELQHRNIPFVAADPGLVRQLGPDRQFTGHNARAALLLRIGTAALTTPPGSRRVAFGEGLSGNALRELARLEHQIEGDLSRAGLLLNRRGEQALQRGEVAPFANATGAGVDAVGLVRSGELVTLVNQHDVVLDPETARHVGPYIRLWQAWAQQTVALFLEPVGAFRRPPQAPRIQGQ